VQQFRRTLAALACVVVAAASFALSYVALRDVAVDVEAVPAHLGWLVPIVIDGGVICGSAVIWSQSKQDHRRARFPFGFVAALVAISVVVNASHAGPALLAKMIASLPPLILLGTLELVASQGRELLNASENVPMSSREPSPKPAPAISPPTPATVPVTTPPPVPVAATVDGDTAPPKSRPRAARTAATPTPTRQRRVQALPPDDV
jgi:hypothetical protein